MGKVKDLTGQRFNELVVLNDSGLRANGAVVWNCVCSCGEPIKVRADRLKSGETKSCGCQRYRNHKGTAKHGGKKTAQTEYSAWLNLRKRSEDLPQKWNDFVEFFCDVGERPDRNHILARKDARKPHGKENTYWRNANEERAAAEQLTTTDLPEECILDFRSILRATASAG